MKHRLTLPEVGRPLYGGARRIGPVEVVCPSCGSYVEILGKAAGVLQYRLHYLPNKGDERCRMSGQPVTGRA
jgi:hypothetical protein